MKHKILFLIQDLGGGGAEKVLVNLVNHMNEEQFDITVMALFSGGVNEKELKSHIRYKTVFSKAMPGNSIVFKFFSPYLLHKAIVREHYDIEVAYLEGNAVRIISGCTDPKTKTFAWIHSTQHTKRIACIGFRNYAEACKQYALFTGIVCVAETIRARMQQWYPELTNLNVIYNTNQTDLIEKQKSEPLDFLLKDDEIKLCGVGKVVPLKRFDVLARIHKHLRDEGYPLHTYILGTGSDEQKIRTYIYENGMQDSFTLTGYRKNPYNLMAQCDIFVCASESEGFSTATTEALLLGLAVVTTPVSGMEELLGKNNENGIIAGMSENDIYIAIKRLLDSPELLMHYKEEARKSSVRFLTAETVRQTEYYLLQK